MTCKYHDRLIDIVIEKTLVYIFASLQNIREVGKYHDRCSSSSSSSSSSRIDDGGYYDKSFL